MRFQKDDILEKNKTIWISQRLIEEVCDIKESFFRTKGRYRYNLSVQPCHRHHNILPDTGKSWRFAKIKNTFYYALENIPNRKPTFYRDLFGDREELIQAYNDAMKNQSISLLEPHFLHYKREISKLYLRAYINYTKIQQQNLCIAAALLEAAVVWIREQEVDHRKYGFFKEFCHLLKKYDIRYLPKNCRKFKVKVLEVHVENKAITDVINLPRQGNTNSKIYTDKDIINWAVTMRSMGQNYSDRAIFRKIRQLCLLTGKNCPEERWFGVNIFEKHRTKFLTAPTRYGEGERYAKLYEGYTPMKNALFAGDCWHVDATRMNLISHKAADGTEKFLFIIAVRDVHSGDVLGYNFDYKEDRWAVLNAVKMAVEQSGYFPYQIVFDRFPGHNTEEVKTAFHHMKQLGVKIEISSSPQSKAKIERWFGTSQSVFMSDSEYYYGEGVKSNRKTAHRSPEYLKVIKKKSKKAGFDLRAAWAESERIVEAYRNTPLSYYSRKFAKIENSPSELHELSEKPNVIESSEMLESMIFGLKKRKKVSNLGLITTIIQGVTYHYQILDYDIFSTEPEVILSYDMNNLSKVHVFKKKDHLLVHLCEAKQFEEVQPYGPQAEFGRMAVEKARIKQINERRKMELLEIQESYDEVSHLMGKFTDKEAAENAETVRILQQMNEDKSIKKVAGMDCDSSNDDDIDFDSLILNQL